VGSWVVLAFFKGTDAGLNVLSPVSIWVDFRFVPGFSSTDFKSGSDLLVSDVEWPHFPPPISSRVQEVSTDLLIFVVEWPRFPPPISSRVQTFRFMSWNGHVFLHRFQVRVGFSTDLLVFDVEWPHLRSSFPNLFERDTPQ